MSSTVKYAALAVLIAVTAGVLVTVIKVYFFGGGNGAIAGSVVGATTGAIYVAMMKKARKDESK